ncbi:hypothetical protein BU16DRAFT_622041 [Lophium mytilinum]|uniref:Uncharacterized protein n=1 Tax=Lophium mytilinum TaxID=390894 RepID=A0A6A6QDT2_9PEZI|nr:hypothetical protein BU16DRAFT_622041 [Lophium mytilinum]
MPGQGKKKRAKKINKPPAKINLTDMPGELIERIALHVLYDDFDDNDSDDQRSTWAGLLFDLRLTCRSLREKSEHIFIRTAFKRFGMTLSLEDLEMLTEVSQLPKIASAVRTLFISEGFKEEKHYNLLSDLQGHTQSAEEHEDTLAEFTDGRNEQIEAAYLGSSGMAASMLTQALKNLPNVRKIFIAIPRRRYYGTISHDSSFQGIPFSNIVSIALTASAVANVKLDEFRMSLQFFKDNYGASVQALQVGMLLPGRFSCLKKLDIYLSAKECHRHAPDVLISYTSHFLAGATELTELNLSFDDWTATDRVFEAIAKDVSLEKLQVLTLEGIRFRAEDIIKFLQAHRTSIRKVKLDTCRISIGTWLQVLQGLKSMQELEDLQLTHIVQQRFRVTFPSTAKIDASSLCDEDDDEFADWVYVTRPYKYIASVEIWEDMPTKLEEFERDIKITDQTYHSDGRGLFHWYT